MIVGERGPEFMIPNFGGTVIPNEVAFGQSDNRVTFESGSVVIHANTEAEGAAAARGFAAELESALIRRGRDRR
jgi:hypothetical protein